MNKSLLIELLANSSLLTLAERYAPQPEGTDQPAMADRLQTYRAQLKAERFVLPIAGIQGSGKSTLLNALAFDEPVLPIDADETTCVPVEIGWAPEPRPQATVYYADGRTEILPCTEQALRSVVHNESNPGNEKQVVRVMLESNRDIFRHGLVLVDLPGTGSLTAANMATTQRYLAEAVGVIFMLRTVPPLTRSEATFVALQWASLRTALFVQNRWNDEDDAEALAGRDHNVKVLQEIAEKAHIPLEKPLMVRVVNGYQALRAALTHDANRAEICGLKALRAELERVGNSWGQRLVESIAAALKADLEHLRNVVGQRFDETLMDRSTHQARMAEEQRGFAEHLQQIEECTVCLTGEAESFRVEVRQLLRTWSNDQGAELRNRMRTKMRAGIVDGPRLARALEDEQSQATDDIFMQVQEMALSLQDKLRSILRDADAWSSLAPDFRATVDRQESTKWESLGDRAGSLGGGAAGAWGGAKLGASIGSLGGPAGAAIGGAVGIVIGGIIGGLAGNWLGKKGKETIVEQRAKAAESEVFSAIDTYLSENSKALNKIAADFSDQLDALLEQWREAEIASFELERQQSLEFMRMSDEEKARVSAVLEADQGQLEALQTQLSEASA